MSTQERIDVQARGGRDAASAARAVGASRSGGERLPRPPGRRRPGLAAIAVLLIVLGAAVAGLLATRIDDRVPVLVARHDLQLGHLITADDLAVAQIASSGISVIPANQSAQVVGEYASTTIPAGRLLDTSMLTNSGLLTPGKAAVGISLATGRFPASGLRSGDVVQVVRTSGLGTVIVARAVVGTVVVPGDSSFGSTGSTDTVVTVLVSDSDSAAVAAAAAASQVSLALLQRGAPAGGG